MKKTVLIFVLVIANLLLIAGLIRVIKVNDSYVKSDSEQLTAPVFDELEENVESNSMKTTVSMCDEVMKHRDKAEIQKYEGEIAEVDFSSLPEARFHRTMITKQVAENGADCAGHYNLSAWGCGVECQGYAVVDVITGTIIKYVPYIPFKVSIGISCRVDSNILVLNPKISTDINGYQSSGYKEERTVKEIAKESHERESDESSKARIYYKLGKYFSGDPYIYPICTENIYAGVAKQ